MSHIAGYVADRCFVVWLAAYLDKYRQVTQSETERVQTLSSSNNGNRSP